MAPRFVKMEPELFALIPLAEEFSLARATPLPLAEACAAPHVALGMLDGGLVLGAGGVLRLSATRGLAWLLPGLWMTRRHFAIAIARCRREIALLHASGMWRVECTVLHAHAARARFVQRMGFAHEGTMVMFGPDGADHDLFAALPATFCERRSLIERLT
jgi:hypothetical protein